MNNHDRCPDTTATPQLFPESHTAQGLPSCAPTATPAQLLRNSDPAVAQLRVYGNATAQLSAEQRNTERNTERNNARNPFSLREAIRNRERNPSATESCAGPKIRHEKKGPAQPAVDRFVKLVQANAALNHCRLLNLSKIEAQLSESDRADLLTTDKPTRQAWATALAYRLCKPWTKCDRQPGGDA